MNATNSGASENTNDAASSRAKKKKKEKRREKKPKHKKGKKRKRKHRSSDSESENTRDSKKMKKCKEKNSVRDSATSESVEMPGPSVPRELLAEQAKARAPMTKEEWEKSQSVIRRVYDESTGRTRLVRGDGEILEEIVSKDRHREINKQATAGDGAFFQNKLQVDRK